MNKMTYVLCPHRAYELVNERNLEFKECWKVSQVNDLSKQKALLAFPE